MSSSSEFNAHAFLAKLTTRPGVYQMQDQQGNVLYVGKAKNLKNRVSSYFREHTNPKTYALVKQIHHIHIIITQTESEALFLENNLIKQHKPRYNILLRDDKSYPYIYVSMPHLYPQMKLYRGNKKSAGQYLGPYTGSASVYECLHLIQKIFKIRSCDDHFFSHRTRPCLQYQIKRCSAPCVALISPEDYRRDVEHAILFLEGNWQPIVTLLAEKMEVAAKSLHYEEAAKYRDQITRIRQVQAPQYVSNDAGDADVISVVGEQIFCVQVHTIRQGRLLGGKAYFPKVPDVNVKPEEILEAFMTQYYLSPHRQKNIPKKILINHVLSQNQKKLLAAVLQELKKSSVKIICPLRGMQHEWVKLCAQNAHYALKQLQQAQDHHLGRLEALQKVLGLEQVPQRLECFDISHTMGEATVASCVVFGVNGPLNSDYRRYNIHNVTPGDDYTAIHQAVLRRYSKLKLSESALPDVVIIDGGKGQLAQAAQVFEELQLPEMTLISIAKGPGRKAGLEKIYQLKRTEPLVLTSDHPALQILQHIRDEAHRFAITGHRQRATKARKTSLLEMIPGIGVQRRRELLRYFGGLQGVQKATIVELEKIPGISKALAQRIYEILHGEQE